jgi:thiamine pyrophosphokinase
MSMTTVVLSGGPLRPEPTPAVLAALGPVLRCGGPDRVVAADSGYRRAEQLGLRVDDLVGDLDSIGTEALERAERAGVRVHRHPRDKDATDLELALEFAAEGCTPGSVARILVVGSSSGRVDHLLALLGALGSERLTDVAVDAVLDDDAVVICRPGTTLLPAGDGATVSLLALGGSARVARTAGLRWPLVDRVLPAMAGLGVSNVVDRSPASLDLAAGVVAVVVPGGVPADPATLPPTDPATLPPTDPATLPPTDPATLPPTDPEVDQ